MRFFKDSVKNAKEFANDFMPNKEVFKSVFGCFFNQNEPTNHIEEDKKPFKKEDETDIIEDEFVIHDFEYYSGVDMDDYFCSEYDITKEIKSAVA